MSAVTSPSAPNAGLPNPSKRVNYTLGMILGVDDFVQEFTYLNGRDQWLARDLLGYGTVSGLGVSLDRDARGPRVSVSPGAALGPRGELIRVCAAQCVYVADWARDYQRQIAELLASPPDDAVSASIVLCYRECAVDPVPIPGEPCRSEQDMLAASRLVDDFTLELRLNSRESGNGGHRPSSAKKMRFAGSSAGWPQCPSWTAGRRLRSRTSS